MHIGPWREYRLASMLQQVEHEQLELLKKQRDLARANVLNALQTHDDVVVTEQVTVPEGGDPPVRPKRRKDIRRDQRRPSVRMEECRPSGRSSARSGRASDRSSRNSARDSCSRSTYRDAAQDDNEGRALLSWIDNLDLADVDLDF
ncbi:Uncharacterized protein PBTT_05944 [Plasmodiophora brassicae]